MASVPVASRPSGLVGVLTVHTRARRIFSERDVVLLTTIGSLVAGAGPSGPAAPPAGRASTRTNGSPSG
jgi:signal transduction protein with GAF and PtsI domain